MNSITLKHHRDKRLYAGHLWVFSNEVYNVEGNPQNGEVVTVKDATGKPFGVGYYNAHSLIAFRLLSRNVAEIDGRFYEAKIRGAVEMRALFREGADAVRLIHSESDGLPGLTVDRIGDVLSVQIVSAGAELHQNYILDALKKVVKPKYIVVRNDSALRKLEGLELYSRVVFGGEPVPVQTIEEHGVKYHVDVMDGQKTGFYIDQHENRKAFRLCVSKGARVLDAFCNDGGFALNAAIVGAGEVLAIDNSDGALARGAENAKMNDVSKKVRFFKADLMKWLPENANNELFDVVNLDPPSFAKNRKTAVSALKGYLKLHISALKMTKVGGFLSTATCSHHIDSDRFVKTVQEAAQKVGKTVRIVHRGYQPADHPVLLAMPETEYLRFFIFQVVD